MKVLYAVIFVYCFIAIVTFLFGMYAVLKINKHANIKLKKISPNIPKVHSFTMADIACTVFVALIPIFNFIYLTVLCFNFQSLIESSINRVVTKSTVSYLQKCKDNKAILQSIINVLNSNHKE